MSDNVTQADTQAAIEVHERYASQDANLALVLKEGLANHRLQSTAAKDAEIADLQAQLAEARADILAINDMREIASDLGCEGLLEALEELSNRRAQLAEQDAENERLRQVAVDRAYMLDAIKPMLGEKGRQVVQKWDERGVKRIHVSWGAEGEKTKGEDRAQIHLDFEEARKDAKPITQIDTLTGDAR